MPETEDSQKAISIIDDIKNNYLPHLQYLFYLEHQQKGSGQSRGDGDGDTDTAVAVAAPAAPAVPTDAADAAADANAPAASVAAPTDAAADANAPAVSVAAPADVAVVDNKQEEKTTSTKQEAKNKIIDGLKLYLKTLFNNQDIRIYDIEHFNSINELMKNKSEKIYNRLKLIKFNVEDDNYLTINFQNNPMTTIDWNNLINVSIFIIKFCRLYNVVTTSFTKNIEATPSSFLKS